MKVELSIIIVNYNGKLFLKDCIDSLKQNLQTISYEIIILDNDSKDGSCLYIKDNFQDVKLIESKINFGFGKGNNEAVKQANGSYVLLLNNDTIILDKLDAIIKLFEQDNEIGVVGINMLNAQKKYLNAAGVFPNFKTMFQFKKLYNLGNEFKKGKFSKDLYEVGWLCGSFLFLKKETYEKIGGFDEDYFMYVEDVDFCKKIANLNLKRIFISNLNYIHFVGFHSKRNLQLIKGYKIYISKHFKGIRKLLMLLILELNYLIKKIKLIFEK